MWDRLKAAVRRLESVLRIDASLDAQSRTRARIIYIVSATFIAMQAFDIASMLVIYGGWDDQIGLSIASCVVFFAVAAGLRWSKNPWVYGTVLGALPLIGVGASAVMGSGFAPPQGVHSDLLPRVVAGMAFLAFVGNRTTSICYALAAVALIWGLYHFTTAGAVARLDVVTAYQRALQAMLALGVVAIVSIPVSGMIYRNLADLEDAVTRAREADEATQALINTMNHELRTPLNGIIGIADLMAQGELPEFERGNLKIIQSSADTLLEMLTEALDRAKAGDFDVAAASQPFSPAAVMEEVCALFKARAANKGVWLGMHGTDALPPALMGDEGILRQVLSNLLSNAVKFTSRGGVRLGAKLGVVDGHSATVLFYVQDTGAGIAPEDQLRVFETFEQSASARTSAMRGTGLGLPICRDLVAAMGGTLSVSSEVGRGSVFHFSLTLPLATVAADPVAKAA